MIETIIKRDGSEEDFDAAKLNKWSAWAAQTLKRVDWSGVVMEVVSTLPSKCTSVELQDRLIKVCLDNDSWEYNRMAGKLYSAALRKKIFDTDKLPTVKEVQEDLVNQGLMAQPNYTDEEYDLIEKFVDHSKDYKAAYFEISQVQNKYGLRNAVTGDVFETQQFVYIRMAMALAEERFEGEEKLEYVERFYKAFSDKKLNAPTPNFINLGTKLKGYASCCTFTTNDDAKSLAIGDHIGYTMTCQSAGLGGLIKTRSEGDPVRNGSIKHMGKRPYYRSFLGAIQANKQAGRGGAGTVYFTGFDPEIKTLMQLKNPMSTDDKKIRGLDYCLGTNKVFARAVARDQDIALFSYNDEPDLFEAQFEDGDLFEILYNKYIENPVKVKKYVKARELIIRAQTEAFETGRSYLNWMDEMNHHTPFKDKIYSSNLCTETAFPTKGYSSMEDLYSTEDHGRGEIGLCSLAAINVGNINSDEEYSEVCYLALLMIDICIDLSDYPLPHLEVTAKARRNAGVGMVGLAYLMAKNKLAYSSQEGKDFIHELAETHAWHLYNASLELGKKYGNAKWMHKTKWIDGWTPLRTYNKNVDSIVTVKPKRNWKELELQVVENDGMRFSVCVNYMPAETSSKASGTTNAAYPIRELTLIKTDESSVTYWAATEGERLSKFYEMAWDIPTKDMIDVYAILQKWTDQSISADLYRKVQGDETITTEEMIKDYLYMTKMGMKSRYYQNSLTSKRKKLDGEEIEEVEISSEDDDACAGGSCKL